MDAGTNLFDDPCISVRSPSLSALLHLAQGWLAAALAVARNVRKLFKRACKLAGIGDGWALVASLDALAEDGEPAAWLTAARGQHHDGAPGAQRKPVDDANGP